MVIIESDYDLNDLNITEDMAVKNLMSKILKHRRKFVKEFNSNYNNFNGIENICKGVLVSLRNEKKLYLNSLPLLEIMCPQKI